MTLTHRSSPPLAIQPGRDVSVSGEGACAVLAIGTEGMISSKKPVPVPYQLLGPDGRVLEAGTVEVDDGGIQSKERTGPECATGMRSS